MFKTLESFFSNNTIKNSFYSIVSNVIQNILLSIFFIILARKYSTLDFSNYIIANTIYSFVLGFSSLGMGHWFIREYLITENKRILTEQFFKIQLMTGFFFYIINILTILILYKSTTVRILSLILGFNLIFDNIIYVIKSLNIAELEQKRSSLLLMLEALMKVIVGIFLFYLPIHIIILCLILIAIRFVTLNIFIHYGTKNILSIFKILKVKSRLKDINEIIKKNWSFVVISSISVINWRIGNIIVSKYLGEYEIASYEISYKLLSICYLIPIMATTSLYPRLISINSENVENLKIIYSKSFVLLCLYGFISFTFIYSYSDYLIPFLFGNKFSDTSSYCKEMFLVMLIFPTIFLQANILLTLKLEKIDMICNIICFAINLILSFTLIQFYPSLSVINYSIFFSFIIFHLIQDVILIKNKIVTPKHLFSFYFISILLVSTYILLSYYLNYQYLFFLYWIIIISFYFIYKRIKKSFEITS